jgi:hypothetical protein
MFDILSHDDGIAMTTNTDAVCNPARLVLELTLCGIEGLDGPSHDLLRGI